MVKRIVQAIGGKLLDYYDREPVRVHTAVAAAVVAVGSAVGIVLSAPAVIIVVAFLAPVLIGEVREVVASPATQEKLLVAQPVVVEESDVVVSRAREPGEPIEAP